MYTRRTSELGTNGCQVSRSPTALSMALGFELGWKGTTEAECKVHPAFPSAASVLIFSRGVSCRPGPNEGHPQGLAGTGSSWAGLAAWTGSLSCNPNTANVMATRPLIGPCAFWFLQASSLFPQVRVGQILKEPYRTSTPTKSAMRTYLYTAYLKLTTQRWP